MKGIYFLVIENEKGKRIRVGALGEHYFPKGFYVYVGSAMNSLENRIRRHYSKNKKKHWHIDYLLEKTNIVKTYYAITKKKRECEAARLNGKVIVKKFGSTDCNCETHLFYYEKDPSEQIREACRKMRLRSFLQRN